MSEPNVFLSDGDSVAVQAVVVDAHWRDKRIYKVRIETQSGPIELYIRDKYLREPESA